MAVCLLASVFLPGAAWGASPVLFFSDLDWGPKSGWEGSATRGAAVSIWGKNLGAARGTSVVVVNGVKLTSDEDYAEWGVTDPARSLTRITFWLNSSAQDGAGNISVLVNGEISNTLPFTILPGTIYFISPSGDNSNTGLMSTSQGGLNGPFRDLYMFNPGQDPMHAAGTANPSGDGQYIVYVRAGAYTTLDVDGSFIPLRGPYGGANRRKALVAYPGEVPVIDAGAAERGVVWPAAYDPYGRLDYFTFSKLSIVNGTWAYGLWGDYNRVVGNQMKDMLSNAWTGSVMVDNSQYAKIYGNRFEHCGFDSYKHNIYIKTHRDYVSGDTSVDHTDVGWNEFANAWAGADQRGGVIFVSRESGTDGKYTGDTKIHHNYFHDGNMDFLYLGDGTPIGDVLVYNNVLRGGTSINGGITIALGATDVAFYNNTFYQIGPGSLPMIWATGTAVAVFENNIWQSQPGQPFFNLETFQGATFTSDHDLFYSPSGSTPPSGTNVNVSGALTSDPMLLDPSGGDFGLQPASPAVDAGVAITEVKDDYDGVPRPQGSSYDIGAFERRSGTDVAVVSVTISPITALLKPGNTQQFTATVSNAANTAVTWTLSADLGSVSDTGLYTPPAIIKTQRTVQVIATSVADPTRTASATLNLSPPPRWPLPLVPRPRRLI
jgi:hypothetical protein